MDPADKLLQDAMTQFPTEYSGIMDYLTLRDAVPEIATNVRFPADPSGAVPNAKYLFAPEGAFAPNLGPAGMMAFGPGVKADTLLHEMTHAAQRALHQQEKERDTSELVKDAIRKLGFTGGPFTSKREKVMRSDKRLEYPHRGVKEQSRKLAPGFESLGNTPEEKAWSDYRTSTPELAAWALGNMTLSPNQKSLSPAPAHHDATLATEMQILLDLATRDMQSRKRK